MENSPGRLQPCTAQQLGENGCLVRNRHMIVGKQVQNLMLGGVLAQAPVKLSEQWRWRWNIQKHIHKHKLQWPAYERFHSEFHTHQWENYLHKCEWSHIDWLISCEHISQRRWTTIVSLILVNRRNWVTTSKEIQGMQTLMIPEQMLK